MDHEGGRSEFDRRIEELQNLISNEERRIYSAIVLSEASNPKNIGRLTGASVHGRIRGSCGDTMSIYLRVIDEQIEEVSFVTDGCGPSVACGSLLTSMIKGKSVNEVNNLSPEDLLAVLGGLPEDSVHCADLAVNTLKEAIGKWRESRQI